MISFNYTNSYAEWYDENINIVIEDEEQINCSKMFALFINFMLKMGYAEETIGKTINGIEPSCIEDWAADTLMGL